MKRKTGAWLRWTNRRTTPVGFLVETRAPATGTPAEFFIEMMTEQRAPWGTSFAQSQAARRA